MEDKDKWIAENSLDFSNEFDKLIVDACWDNKVTDPDLVNICVSISRVETGHYKSFVAKNNFGGMVNSTATKKLKESGNKGTIWYTFSTPKDGVKAFVKNLNNNYFSNGLVEIEDIGNGIKGKYPGYTRHDPDSGNPLLNNPNWIPNVTKVVEQIATKRDTLPNYNGSYNADPNKAKTFDEHTISQERVSTQRFNQSSVLGPISTFGEPLKTNRFETDNGYIF